MRRCRGCGSLHFATRPVPFCPFSRSRPFRPVLPVHPVPSRSAAGCYLPCVAALRTGHCLRHSHASVTSFHLIRSSSLSLALLHFGHFSGARLFVVSAARFLSFGRHSPFPSADSMAQVCCRFRRADLFRWHVSVPVRPMEGGRVVGKIGKLSVLSKLLSIFLLGTGAHPPGGADVRRVRDHLSARAKGPCRGRVVAVMTSVIWGRCFSGRSPIHRCIEPLRCR